MKKLRRVIEEYETWDIFVRLTIGFIGTRMVLRVIYDIFHFHSFKELLFYLLINL